MDRNALEARLGEFPLYSYDFLDPKELEFSNRIRWICEHECPMYGKTWACPPGVGTVEECRSRCLSYNRCLMIATITEVSTSPTSTKPWTPDRSMRRSPTRSGM